MGREPPRIKLVEYHPLPVWDCASLFGNHVEFTIIKGEPILIVENSYEFFFLSKEHCGKTWDRCYLGIPGILRLSPDRFFSFSNMAIRKRAEWQGSSGKGGRCSIFIAEKYFYHHRASNDGSVLSHSLTILCSVTGISHSQGGTSL